MHFVKAAFTNFLIDVNKSIAEHCIVVADCQLMHVNENRLGHFLVDAFYRLCFSFRFCHYVVCTST